MIADLFKGRCKWHIKLSIQVQISGRETTKKILKEGKNDDMNCLKYMHYKMTLRQSENQWSCVNCFFFFFGKGRWMVAINLNERFLKMVPWEQRGANKCS